MLVTDANKVVLHMPRCGGSSVRWALMDAGYRYQFSCEHAPIDLLPARYADLPRIGFVRNPLTWYASRFYYGRRGHAAARKRKSVGSGILIYVLSGGFNVSFDTFVNNSLDMETFFSRPGMMDNLKSRITQVIMNTYVCWHAFTWENVQELKPSDFQGSLYDYMFKKVGLSSATVYPIEAGIQEAIDCEFDKPVKIGHRNSGPQVDLMGVYDLDTIARVSRVDSVYFDRFNYSTIIDPKAKI